MRVLIGSKKGMHLCRFSKAIVSKYVSFSTRDIIYQCKCGKRRCKRVTKAFEANFPIQTTNLISDKEFDHILAGGNNWTEVLVNQK